MPFVESNGLRYFRFDSLNADHAVFTRRGGVSPKPWDSLNVGGSVGDDLDNVRTNRIRSFEVLGCNPGSMFDVWLVHSTDVVIADSPRLRGDEYKKADIILTDKPGLTLFLRYADCVPLLLHDPIKKVIGISHAGWMGTVRDVAGTTIKSMVENYGSDPANIVACIGPSIGPDHYEVGEDVIQQVRETFGNDSDLVLQPHGGRIHFDLWKSNQMQLVRAGVRHIANAGICTACHTDDWFSHRAEMGKTGRFGALITLAPPY